MNDDPFADDGWTDTVDPYGSDDPYLEEEIPPAEDFPPEDPYGEDLSSEDPFSDSLSEDPAENEEPLEELEELEEPEPEEETISAIISWGDMEFSYVEKERKWVCPYESNKITVLNTSARTPVKAAYAYRPKNGYSDYGTGLFDWDLTEFATESDAFLWYSLYDTFTTEAIQPGEEDSRWLMLTEPAGEELPDTFVRIGTLSVEITPA